MMFLYKSKHFQFLREHVKILYLISKYYTKIIFAITESKLITACALQFHKDPKEKLKNNILNPIIDFQISILIFVPRITHTWMSWMYYYPL